MIKCIETHGRDHKICDSSNRLVNSAVAFLVTLTFPWELETLGNSLTFLIFAGIYQLTPLKQACLEYCRGPIAFLTRHWESGVEVTVITNSLAANNQFTVHGGYAPSRKPLLEAGVKIYEVRPDADVQGTEFVNASGAKATLHTKSFIVDEEEIFIGSFNFDPRSANINTELGVIIYDPDLALIYAELIDEALPFQTYEVFLNEKGKVRWRGFVDGEEVIYEKEPDTTWGQRFSAGFARILPKSQL